jgi:hypothetical protein
MSLIGAVKSLASHQCWNFIGIVVQVKEDHIVENCDPCKKPKKCFTKIPYIYTIKYNGCVTWIPLAQLARDKLIRRLGVRLLKPTCNECTDSKRNKNLVCIMREYQNKSYEADGAAVMRNIFNLDVVNPNYEGFTDTKLVYSVLFRNATVKDNGCCEKPVECSTPVESSGRVDSLSCETDPCAEQCCQSSSDCEKCELSCYQASQVTLADFLYDKADGCLDMRWYSSLIPVWSECGTKGHDAAIDKAFCEQNQRLIRDLRQLVSCWSAGQSLPCLPQCKDKCKDESSEDDCSCKVSQCSIQEITSKLDIIYTYLSGVNYAGIPTPIPTSLDGNYITGLFNDILKALCQRCDRYIVNTTYSYPDAGGINVYFKKPLDAPIRPANGDSLVEQLVSTYGTRS